MRKLWFYLNLFFLFPVLAGQIRIVSLSPGTTELLCLLGGRKLLCGRSSACDWPPEVKNLPIAGDFADPQLEKLLRLRPTLVISNDLINPGIAAVLVRSGIRCEIFPCRNLAEYLSAVEKLGFLTGLKANAAREIDRVKKLSRPHPAPGVKALYVVWDSPAMAAGPGSLPAEAFRLAGLTNAAAELNQPYARVSGEWLLTHPAEIILWGAAPRKPEMLKKHRLWGKLPAVRQNRVLFISPADPLQRPGPRFFDRVEKLRKETEVLLKK